MKNIEKIISRIDLDAQEQINKINSDSELAISDLKAEYAEKTEARVSEIIEDAKLEAKRIAERRDSAVKLEGRNYTLSMKQGVISKLFDKASDVLCALPDEEYTELLASFAVNASESGKESVIMSESDRQRCGNAVTEKANDILRNKGRTACLTLSDETRNIRGGLILSDGKIEYNCAMDAVVGSYKNELTMTAANILFE